MRETVLEVIPDGTIYFSEGIPHLDAGFSSKETAAQMVFVLLEIVGGVILDVGSVALVSLHDVHRIDALGVHGGEVLVIYAHLWLDPQSLFVVGIMNQIISHVEWDADEIVVVSGVPGVTAQILVQVVALYESDAGSHSQVVNCQIFCPDTSRHSRSHLIGSGGQARYIRIEHAATDACFSLHLPSVGGLLSLNA